MSWSPAQQAMLEAMGYTLWRHAGAPAPAPAVAEAATRAAAVTAGMQPAGDSPGTDDALLRALRRAAGGAELSALALPPLAALRGDPGAKRALWPRLRALRRRR